MTGEGFAIPHDARSTRWEWVVAAPRRVRCIAVVRARRPAGVPALEPGPGPAPGADHDRDLGDRRRPGDRPLPAARPRSRGSAATPSASPGRAGRTGSSTCTSGTSSTRSRACRCSASASPSGVALWLWLYRTQDRDGDPRRRRRPADDLGARDQHPEDVRDRVRRRLGARGASAPSWAPRRANVAPGQDGQWLLNSLVVVIIGGMGSLFGAAAGALLYGLVVLVLGRLPADDRRQLLHPVLDRLHLRPDRARARLPAAGPVRERRG